MKKSTIFKGGPRGPSRHPEPIDRMAPTRSEIADELSALYEVGTTLLQTLEVEAVLSLICDHALNLLEAEGSGVVQYDEANDEFVVRTAAGSLEQSLDSRFPAEGSLSGMALETREPVIENQVPESTAKDAAQSLPSPIHKAIVVPLVVTLDDETLAHLHQLESIGVRSLQEIHES